MFLPVITVSATAIIVACSMLVKMRMFQAALLFHVLSLHPSVCLLLVSCWMSFCHCLFYTVGYVGYGHVLHSQLKKTQQNCEFKRECLFITLNMVTQTAF